MASFGFHVTPTKNLEGVKEKGVVRQWFWKSRVPLHHPLKALKPLHEANAYVFEDFKGTQEEIGLVRDRMSRALKYANEHLTGDRRLPLRYEELSVLALDPAKAALRPARKDPFKRTARQIPAEAVEPLAVSSGELESLRRKNAGKLPESLHADVVNLLVEKLLRSRKQ